MHGIEFTGTLGILTVAKRRRLIPALKQETHQSIGKLFFRGVQVSKERAASLIFLVFGIYGVIFSINIPMGEWQSPGPGIFPLGVSIVLCLSGAAWFIANGKSVPIETVRWRTAGKNAVRPLKVVGITLIFILLMDRTGYLLGSSLYLFTLLLLVSRYRFSVALAFAVALGGGSWFFFGKLLGVELPMGPGFLS